VIDNDRVVIHHKYLVIIELTYILDAVQLFFEAHFCVIKHLDYYFIIHNNVIANNIHPNISVDKMLDVYTHVLCVVES
jgi:hypothetical protein